MNRRGKNSDSISGLNLRDELQAQLSMSSEIIRVAKVFQVLIEEVSEIKSGIVVTCEKQPGEYAVP